MAARAPTSPPANASVEWNQFCAHFLAQGIRLKHTCFALAFCLSPLLIREPHARYPWPEVGSMPTIVAGDVVTASGGPLTAF